MMKIENIKKGQVVNHKRYGKATLSDIYVDGVLLDNLSDEAVKLLNKDRLIKNMPNTETLTRCFEDNMSLLS